MKKFFKIIFLLTCWLYGYTYSLTIEEAVEKAKENLPLYMQKKSDFQSYFLRYRASIGGFFPRLNYEFSYTKYNDISPVNYSTKIHSLTLNWNIYDSGYTFFNFKSEKYLFQSAKSDFDESVLDIIYLVKAAYLKAAASKETLKFRKIQFKSAKVDYDLAVDKKRLGLVKKSDVLQAEVRFKNAKYNLIQAENDFKKSLADLNSLIGRPLDFDTEINPDILEKYISGDFPTFVELKKAVLNLRPKIKSYRNLINAYRERANISLFKFTPNINVFYSLNFYDHSLNGYDNYSLYGISINWNIFSGLKRYYEYLSLKEEERVNRYALEELKRNIILELYKRFEDLKTAYTKLEVAEVILKQAEVNYEQVLGEYKAGTSNIIDLLTAESSLASAHERYIQTVLDICLTKIAIEREVGVDDITRLWSGK
ncbi:TolC family protein [Persephonella sp.]